MTDRYREYLEKKASEGDRNAMFQLGINPDDSEIEIIEDDNQIKGMYFENNTPTKPKAKPTGWHNRNERTGFNTNKGKKPRPFDVYEDFNY